MPAAKNLGVRRVFIDNLKRSAMTDRTPFPQGFESGGDDWPVDAPPSWDRHPSGQGSWNMCCGHAYETAPELGGDQAVRRLVDACEQHGITPFSWTNNDQAISSPLNQAEREDGTGRFVLLEDTRQKYGGAYTGCQSIFDLSTPEAADYFVNAHLRLKQNSGIRAYLFDSFYNIAFMPVSYRDGRPHTMWRGALSVLKRLQDGGVRFMIESFGPFGQPQHGCPRSYSIDRAWVVYQIGVGDDYTTVPSGSRFDDPCVQDAAGVYYLLAHQSLPKMPLFEDGVRIDKRWDDEHRAALRDYHAAEPFMYRRYLQADGLSVLWHDRQSKRLTLFNFSDRPVRLPGVVSDLTDGVTLNQSDSYLLKAGHTYRLVVVGHSFTRVETAEASAVVEMDSANPTGW